VSDSVSRPTPTSPLGKDRVIAIDGAAGTGKSTVAARVAVAMNGVMIDTGALYRAMTIALLDSGGRFSIDQLAVRTQLRCAFSPAATRVWIDDDEVTARIRTPEVTRAIKPIADHPAIRARVNQAARDAAAAQGLCVVEGRDSGTVIFPNAACKVFLFASLEERARRRQIELEERGIDQAVETVLQDIAERDAADEARAIAPLVQAADAVRITTDTLSVDEVVREIVKVAKAVFAS
jgi:cytidylate kinase